MEPDRLDLRSLESTRETIAYANGGLFPVLVATRDGGYLAIVRGGAGHYGREGRIDLVRSADGGRTWSAPTILADSKRDDRNPSIGVLRDGTIVACYQRQGSYDDEGCYRAKPPSDLGDRPIDLVVTRSADDGWSWEAPQNLAIPWLQSASPFGRMVELADGTLIMPVYGHATEYGRDPKSNSYLVRSSDGGRTWSDVSRISSGMTETTVLALGDGALIAAMRADDDVQGLHVARSLDAGRTWNSPQPITGAHEHPADLTELSAGVVVVWYARRTPPYRIEGRLSRDGGRSWLDLRLVVSGPLYGVDLDDPRTTDFGYPSTCVANGRGTTIYYQHIAPWRLARVDDRYRSDNYRATAVSWSEPELVAALRGHGVL